MRPLRYIFAAILPLFVSACYMSTKPLITAENGGVLPYQSITYVDTSQKDAKPQTIVRDGDTYSITNEKGETIHMMFKPVEGDFYVVQMGGDLGGQEGYLYGLIKFDKATNVVSAYAMIASKDDVTASGLPACPDNEDSACLTDVDAYAKYAMTKTATPMATYQVTELK